MLVNGQWSKDWNPYQKTNNKGEFLRQVSEFRHWITPDGSAGRTGVGGFTAEPNRYHLYVAYICPWACRTLMVRALKGLESLISVSVVQPYLTEKSWQFGDFPGANREPHFGYDYLYQLYTHANPTYTGRPTVPILWDKKQNTIVNNESADIIEMFNDAFDKYVGSELNLRPTDKLEEMNSLNEQIYKNLNNGVYRAGFAQSQTAYEEAYATVFSTLEEMEDRLSHHPYLLGNELTESDIRLFVTLVRFDAAYHGLFKCNKKRLTDYPNLTDYAHRIYSKPGIKATVNLQHIKAGYYSIKAINPQQIIPLGPDDYGWNR